MKLRLKLIISYVLVVLVSFGFVAFYLSKNLEDHSLGELKSSLINQAYLISAELNTSDLKAAEFDSLEAKAKEISERIRCRITIINNQGVVLADSNKSEEDIPGMDNHAGRPEIKQALEGKTGIETRYSATLKIDMLYVALPIKDKNSIVGAVRVSLPVSSVREALFTIRKTVFIGFVFALALAFVLASILSRQIIKPIHKIIRASRRFSKGDFSRKIFQDSEDEIGELSLTLNKMAQQIQEKISQIETQNQKMTAIFSNMAEAVLVIDKTLHVVSINPAGEKIFGVKKNIVENKLFLEAIPNNDILEVVNKALNEGKPISQEMNLVWPLQRVFQINASAIFESDVTSGCLLVIRDITEIRRLETMRRDFVANVSHELKTPLTSIKGFIETLMEGAVDDKENRMNFLRIIHEHSERLNSLINDLLDLSYLESKQAGLNKEELDLGKLIATVISGFKAQAKQKDVEITSRIADRTIIEADKDKIEQVFINLIDNAIKFNKKGGTIGIYSEDLGDKIKIIVEDSGIGIPAKDIGRIFERFYRVDKARSRQMGGTGLGLSIVKHIIELHGGSVGIDSTEGLGSRFWLILPRK